MEALTLSAATERDNDAAAAAALGPEFPRTAVGSLAEVEDAGAETGGMRDHSLQPEGSCFC